MTSFPALRTLFAELVRRPSMSSEDARFDVGNRAVVETLAGWLGDAGFACEVLPVAGRAASFNLVATRGAGPGGLVLAGHSDTVPYDEHGWASDPFALAERDGRLYGLGICDMKGFLAMAVQVAHELKDTALRQPLIVLATADEERAMEGARALAAAGRPRARYAVIGEPTALAPVRAHKGIFMETVRVLGRGGHSSRPDLGANAIDGMHRVLGALSAFRADLARRAGPAAFAIPHPTLNCGAIHGGDSINRIPACCELHLDLRFPPGQSRDALRAELRQRAAAAIDGSGCEVQFEAVFDGIEAFETAAASPLVAACERLTGHAAGVVDFGTEAPLLTALGMQTIVLGPGSIEQAHKPDEYLGLDRVEPMLTILRGLVREFCL